MPSIHDDGAEIARAEMIVIFPGAGLGKRKRPGLAFSDALTSVKRSVGRIRAMLG